MNTDLHALLLANELELLTPQVRHSEARLKDLLADGFVEFGSSGRIFDKQSVIDALTQSPESVSFSIEDFRLVMSSDDTALVTYRCVASSEACESVRISNRSSLWSRAGDVWQLLFHQGTRSKND